MDHVFEATKREANGVLNKVTKQGRPTQEKLVQDFKTMISDAEELLRSVAGASGEGIAMAREQFSDKLGTAKQLCADAEESVRSRVDAAAKATTDYAADNPWRTIAVAASVGAVLGYLINRR